MQRTGLGRREQLLGEGGLERAQPRVHRLELGLLGARQLGAGVQELLVVNIEQLGLLGVEIELRLMVVKILHPAEQFRVQENEVLVLREQGRSLGVDRLQRVIGVGAIDREKARFARSSSWPERSSATKVLSKVGVAVWLAIAVTSRFCCAIPARSAGR